MNATNLPLEKFDIKKIYKTEKVIKFKKKILYGVKLNDDTTPSNKGNKYKKEFLFSFKFKLFFKVF